MRKYTGPHTHPCSTDGCTVKVECDGAWERNYDGWPEVICVEYHEREHGIAYCDDCRDRQDRACEVCGEAEATTERGDGGAAATVECCQPCAEAIDAEQARTGCGECGTGPDEGCIHETE